MYLIVALCNVQRIKFQSHCSLKITIMLYLLTNRCANREPRKAGRGYEKNPNLKIWQKIGCIMLDTDVFAMFNPCNGTG